MPETRVIPHGQLPLRHRRLLRPVTAGVSCLVAGVMALGVDQASAARGVTPAVAKARVASVVNVSGPSPWHGLNCDTPASGWASGFPRTAEPSIAVDPTNPRRQAAAWIDNDSGPVDTAFTDDGGQTWHKALPVGVDPCTGLVSTAGHAYEGSADPWLSYGADGTLYLADLTQQNFVAPPITSYVDPLVVQRASNSSDWSQPVTTPNPFMVDDKDEILADRSNPRIVYTIDRNTGAGDPVGVRGDGQLLFKRSTDGGITWTETVLADAHDANASFPGYPHLVQLANGTLVATGEFPPSLGGGTRAFWSTDKGATWSGPGTTQPSLPASASPELCGVAVGWRPDGAQDAVLDGTAVLAVAAVDPTPTGPGHIVMFRSNNAGRTWTSSTIYTAPSPITLPTLTTDRNGRIGLLFDQVNVARRSCAPAPTLPVRTVFVVSRDAGHTWSQPVTIGAPRWNLASAPEMGYFFDSWWLGEYSQLAAVPGRGFAVVAIQGKPLGARAGGPPITGFQSTVVAEVEVSERGRSRH